jgi:hypothetical protein
VGHVEVMKLVKLFLSGGFSEKGKLLSKLR